MNYFAPSFMPIPSKKTQQHSNGENPENAPYQKVVHEKEEKIATRPYADMTEFELQIQCVRMVDGLLDDNKANTKQVSNYREKLLKFQ